MRRDVQGMRALAVVAVISNHLTQWPRGGFVGVDVFFVISGFLITGLLLREHERTGRISFTAFYRRRVKRILPAMALVLATTLAASWFVFNADRWRSTALDALWAMLSAANWRFALQSTDYFQQDRAVSPLQHYWSLGVEEQFYFVWPWLLVLVLTLAAGSVWWRRHDRTLAGTAIAVISIASFAWALHESRTAPSFAYFSTLARIWELGVGAFVAVVAPMLSRLPNALRPCLGWVGLIGVLVSVFTVPSDSGFPAPGAAYPVLATALVIAAGTGAGQQRALFPLTNRVSGYLGDISYSLYLWHFPVIILGTAVLTDGPLVRAGLAGALLIISIYSFHLLEDPVRRSSWLEGPSSGHRRRHHRHHRRHPSSGAVSLTYKMTSLSLLAAVVLGLVTIAGLRSMPTTHTATVAPVDTVASAPTGSVAKPELADLQAQISRSLAVDTWPTLQPSIDDALAEKKEYDDVKLCGFPDRQDARCVWGDPKATHTMITVGNSTSAVYSRTLRSVIGTDAGWKLIPFGMYGCPFGDTTLDPPPADALKGCAERPDAAVEAINRLKPDVVVISGTASLNAVLSELNKVTVKVTYVVIPGPPVDKDISACYTKVSTPADCVSTVPPEWGRRDRTLARELGGVFVDSSAWYCVRSKCPSFVGTVPTKLDPQHLTKQYSETIAPVVREELVSRKILASS